MDMQMSWTHVDRPLYLNCGLILMFAYPILSILLFRSRRVSRLMAILLPLFGGGVLGWIGVRMAFMGMAISGAGGFAAVAAGLAEALIAVTAGAAVSCITAVIAMFFSSTAGPAGSQRYWDAILASLGLLFVVALLAVIVITVRGDFSNPQTLARIVTLGAWVGPVIFAAALAALPSRAQQPLSLTFAALGISLIIGIATWLLQRRIVMSAMSGRLPF